LPSLLNTVGWASGRAFDLLKLSDEVLAWLSVWSELLQAAVSPKWTQILESHN